MQQEDERGLDASPECERCQELEEQLAEERRLIWTLLVILGAVVLWFLIWGPFSTP